MSHLEMQIHEYQDLTQTIDYFLDGLSSQHWLPLTSTDFT